MSIPELSIPIRLYWDIAPVPWASPDRERIADEIIALKILHLDITAYGECNPECFGSVIKRFAASRIAVVLTVSTDSLERTICEVLPFCSLKELLVEVRSLAEAKSLLPLQSAVTGFSFPVTDRNWKEIPLLIRLLSESGVKRLVFPMQRLHADETPFYLSVQNQNIVASELSTVSPYENLRITAHDPFIWRAVFPHSAFPNGRCQAANTMLYIAPDGVVYPCPVMPVPIGDLKIDSLRHLATGNIKKNIRAKLLNLPMECASCAMADSCKGGCRGRSERIYSSWDKIDPGCK